MITASDLRRVAARVGQVLSEHYDPAHPIIQATRAVVLELKDIETASADDTYVRARDRYDNGLWQHGCGHVAIGAPVTDLQPRRCARCVEERPWKRLYTRLSE